MGRLWTAATLKAKDFSVQLEIFRPKRCGHTNRGQTLAATGRHEVSVGGRCRRMAGSAAYQRVDRPYSLLAQNEGSVTDQTEKAFVFRAEAEISWSPFPTKAGAPVGTRLHRSLCNILKSHCNFKSLPTDRKPGAGVDAGDDRLQSRPVEHRIQPVQPLALLAPTPHDAVRQAKLPKVTPRHRRTSAPFPTLNQKLGGRAKVSRYPISAA